MEVDAKEEKSSQEDAKPEEDISDSKPDEN